jgi:hypothetical protein
MTELSRRNELVLVACAIVLLELIVYLGYFTGALTPAFDFHSTYNYEAYAWWHDGGILNPPQWMPYLWGGYPAVSNLQNGSYYLPIGITALFGGYSIHAAAVLSALHVGFGAVGAYLVARRWGAGVLPAMLALVAWFFAIGFTANAQHLDIFRGYAWFPWLLLVASVRWPWRRWWAVPVAGLIVWQSILGTYPGMLVAFAYALAAWVIIQLVLYRPKLVEFLVPLAAAGVGGVLMTLLRFLPALAERGLRPFESADLSTFGPAHLGTLLYPYGISEFADAMMPLQPWFLGGAVLALLLFVTVRRDRLMLGFLIPLTVAAALGLPFWPWHQVESILPGLDLSRFRASDFKPVILFLVVLLTVFALDHLLRTAVERSRLSATRAKTVLLHWAVPMLLTAQLAIVMVWLIGRYGFPVAESVAQLGLFLVSAALVVTALLLRTRRVRLGLAVGLVAIAAASGILSAYAGSGFWRSDRVETEVAYLGAPVGELIAARVEPGDQRPARIAPPPPDQPQENLAGFYSAAFYSGVPSLYGYVNLRGTESFEIVRESVIFDDDPEAPDARDFWSAAGMLLRTDGERLPDGGASQRCAASGTCGAGLEVTPESYRSGRLAYLVDADAAMTVSANETWFKGWQISVCEPGGSDCSTTPAHRGQDGQIVFEVPEGRHLVVLEYSLPFQGLAWALFAAGLGVLALGAVLVVRRRSLSGGSGAAAEPVRAGAHPPERRD